ncbi:hypothetical protein D3C81_1214810 [compost metagenome]
MPAGKPVGTVEGAHDPAGQRRADQPGQRHGGGEQGIHLAAAVGREPVGQIEDDARVEPGFGDPQQEAHDVEGHRCAHQGHGRGDDAPGDHDACDPQPCADAMEDQVAGDFHEEVGNEEDPCAKAVDGFGKL